MSPAPKIWSKDQLLFKKNEIRIITLIWEPAFNRNTFLLPRSESGERLVRRERAAAWHGAHLEGVQRPTQQHAQRLHQQARITTQQAAGRRAHRQGDLQSNSRPISGVAGRQVSLERCEKQIHIYKHSLFFLGCVWRCSDIFWWKLQDDAALCLLPRLRAFH